MNRKLLVGLFSVAAVVAAPIIAVAQDCLILPDGRRMCFIARTPVAVVQTATLVAPRVSSVGCSGVPASTSCDGVQATSCSGASQVTVVTVRKGLFQRIRERRQARKAAKSSLGCAGSQSSGCSSLTASRCGG